MDTLAHSRNTQLKDRTLWYDGDSSYDSKKLFSLIQRFDVSYVDSLTDDVREYNRSVSKSKALTVKTESKPLSVEWDLPKADATRDVVQYVFDKHYAEYGHLPTAEFEQREERLSIELVKYKKYGFFDVLRTIIFIINKLTTHNVVWGVGRGSSVSSYVMYVIGVHDVDSFAYDLDINDFLHE